MLASTLSFGLRLVWLGVILFFFCKLVQKVQELIRPGAASIAPNLAGDVQRRTTGGARTLTRAATRSTAGAGAGVIAAGQRRRMMAADPTRGPIRRGAGTLLTPVSLLTGGLRGAALGPQDAHRRSFRTMSKAQVNAVKATNTANAGGGPKRAHPVRPEAPEQPGTGTTGARAVRTVRRSPANPNVRAAGSSHGTARDAATVGPVLPRRRPPTPENRTGATDSAEEAETFDTVSLQRAPLPQTDQIPRRPHRPSSSHDPMRRIRAHPPHPPDPSRPHWMPVTPATTSPTDAHWSRPPPVRPERTAPDDTITPTRGLVPDRHDGASSRRQRPVVLVGAVVLLWWAYLTVGANLPWLLTAVAASLVAVWMLRHHPGVAACVAIGAVTAAVPAVTCVILIDRQTDRARPMWLPCSPGTSWSHPSQPWSPPRCAPPWSRRR